MSEVDCTKCKHEGTDECEECSEGPNRPMSGCSCHLNPPCSYCENLMFEVKETEEDK
jgi:hypothetical protein